LCNIQDSLLACNPALKYQANRCRQKSQR